jgi:hypothetical protein
VTRVSLHKNNQNNEGRKLLRVHRLQISFALEQKTANFKVAIGNRVVQGSLLTEEKQKNQLAIKEFSFIKTIIIIRAAAITSSPSRPHQRCTRAKDGKLQGGLLRQSNAVEFFD